MSPMSVAQVAPQILNADAVAQAISTIIYNFNLLAEDQHRTHEMALETQKIVEAQSHRIATNTDALNDLHQLIVFLETNPGADLKDWVKYEAVKERFRRATNGMGQV